MNRWWLLPGFALLFAVHLAVPLAPLDALDPETARLILVELRLPRTLLAIGYGLSLGMAGAALQAIFANPLASPDITGAASGGALGAVTVAYVFGLSGAVAMAAGGAVGAGLALALLFVVAGRNAPPARLLLGGLAIALAAGSATALLLALAPSPFAFYEMWRWLMGSLADRSLPQAAAALVPALSACALLWRGRKAYDLIALGDDVSASLGIDPRRLATRAMVLAAIATGACVALCGAIGFVGLVAPIAARALVRGHPGRAILPAGVLGALLLMGADLLVRFAPAGREIPVGVVTSLIGTPLFILVLLRARGMAGGLR
ncbi:FecCD family ABC transporter permease [Sphingomicrobium nitratireducens]|uniref:FecCD family ABC transporter permease n=1 Tax=Sphingomicrobium nitratireducens TaxID=2964666 RepID=UPI0022407D86|nr:iron ABC transporter permease [Sphingomicrobium nitratireducens]